MTAGALFRSRFPFIRFSLSLSLSRRHARLDSVSFSDAKLTFAKSDEKGWRAQGDTRGRKQPRPEKIPGSGARAFRTRNALREREGRRTRGGNALSRLV